MKPLYNSVLPSRIYGVWHGSKQVGEVQAKDVNEAYDLAMENKKWNWHPCAVIFKAEVSAKQQHNGQSRTQQRKANRNNRS